MRIKTLFIIYAVISAVFGLTFVFTPVKTLAIYGITLDPGGITITRLFGASLLEFAFLSWFVRNLGESGTRKAIILALFIGEVIGFFVALFGQLSGAVNPLGWSTVAVYLLLATAFGYFYFSKPEAP